MRVLHIHSHASSMGGAEQILIKISDEFMKRGIYSSAIYAGGTPYDIKENLNFHYHIIPELASSESVNPNGIAKLSEVIKEEKPDIFFIHNYHNFEVLRRLKELGHVVRFVHDEVSYCLDRAKIWPIPKLWPICKIKLTPACLLCTMCHTYINRNSDKNPAILKKYYSLYNERRKLLKYLCEIDMIFAPSGYIRDTLQQNGLPPDKIKVVNLPGFDDTSAYSDSTGTSSESYILFAGRLVYLKGCQYLIRAMTKINENCKLIICGNGTYEHKLKEIAIHNNLQNRITFINWLSKGEINKYFANAKLIVVPSIWPEPGGTVGIEALSFGKPIVAFNVGGNSEWLKDGYNGFMVPRRNESLLADAINKILGNPQIAQRFGANSKTLYTRKFTLESFIAQIEYNLRNISTG